jgi:sulfate transport system permease protein
MSARRARGPLEDPPWVRGARITIAVAFLLVFLVTPLVLVFTAAFKAGPAAYWASIQDPVALSAVKLTILTALVVVPLNVLFGIAAAWAIAKFDFPGRRLLITMIDLPFSVSPVISGMLFVLLFGAHGILGAWLEQNGIQIIFALPGIILATAFVTFPFVARELLPLMEAQENEPEEAALTLGASPWQMFRRVSLPRIKWGILYGAVLCNARAMGEFGAVSVVSGHIRGQTNTIPLHVEILYNEYQLSAAFAVASLLTVLAIVTLIAKSILEWKVGTKHG